MKNNKKTRTVSDIYGRGYDAYVRAYEERAYIIRHRKTKSLRRNIAPLLSREEYKVWDELFRTSNKKIDIVRKDLGQKPLPRININKQIIEYQSTGSDLKGKQLSTVAKNLGLFMAREDMKDKIMKEVPDLPEAAAKELVNMMDIKPAKVYPSQIRAGDYLYDEKIKTRAAQFWDSVRDEQARLAADGVSKKDIGRIIAQTFFGSPD